jgi:cytochrome c-type biogenesis protein CcmF
MPDVPGIGQFSLIIALIVAVLQSSMIVAARRKSSWMSAAVPLAKLQFILVAAAFLSLAYSFVTNDFSVLNVARNSNSELPLQYRFAATWGSHEGSILLWIFMLSFWTAAVSIFTRRLAREVVARVLGVMGVISVGFLLFMLITSNPFTRLIPAPVDGNDLNALLQDPGMVVHPPMLYMGYVGFSVAFAFAVAALLGNRLDTSWARWSRPWTLIAWTFLTCGIALGSYWSYYVQGWGGWWFWDPVENASFMPWLAGTALIHSLAVTEKRGAFKAWTVLLAIAAFSLSLLGTFLVRSGVLTSVHAFATDPKRGIFILCFLAIIIGGSLLLYALRVRQTSSEASFDVLSRESLLLSNNVLLTAAAASVLLGTVYPLIIDALNLGKLSVGPPYFNSVFVAIMSPAMFLLGIGPIAKWRNAELPELVMRLRWAFAISLIAGIFIPFLVQWKPLVSLGLTLSIWMMTTIALNFVHKLKTASSKSLVQSLRALPRNYFGMQLAHFGVAVTIVGITIVTGYESQKDLLLSVGESTEVGGYRFEFRGISGAEGPNYDAVRADMDVFLNGSRVLRMHPERRIYHASGNDLTNAAISSGVFRDLYVALGDPIEGAPEWTFRIQYKPFVGWIWAGAVFMALGGALACSDRRYTSASTLAQARQSA